MDEENKDDTPEEETPQEPSAEDVPNTDQLPPLPPVEDDPDPQLPSADEEPEPKLPAGAADNAEEPPAASASSDDAGWKTSPGGKPAEELATTLPTGAEPDAGDDPWTTAPIERDKPAASRTDAEKPLPPLPPSEAPAVPGASEPREIDTAQGTSTVVTEEKTGPNSIEFMENIGVKEPQTQRLILFGGGGLLLLCCTCSCIAVAIGLFLPAGGF